MWPNGASPQVAESRSYFWAQLSMLLHSIPKRNMVVLGAGSQHALLAAPWIGRKGGSQTTIEMLNLRLLCRKINLFCSILGVVLEPPVAILPYMVKHAVRLISLPCHGGCGVSPHCTACL